MTLTQAQKIYDALLQEQIDNPMGNMGSTTTAGRTFTYRNAQDLIQLINYWARIVASLKRVASGRSRHGYAVADFSR